MTKGHAMIKGYIAEIHDYLSPYDAAMDIADTRCAEEGLEEYVLDTLVMQLTNQIASARRA